jgi:hypothetical protein
MINPIHTSQPLNEVQLMLLRLFSRPIAPKDLDAIRKMLLEYYNKALQNELDRVIEEKNITREDFEAILNSQQRTK